MPHSEIYAFGDYMLDVAERRLVNGRDAVPLAPKAFDLLVALLRGAGRLQTKEELLAAVWRDVDVGEGILAVHISALRKALGDSTRAPRHIETVARSGYRFIASVTAAHIVGSGAHRALSSGISAPHRPHASIAVLPFVNLSANANDVYFSDGLAEEITTALTRVEGLEVAGRTSAFSFRGTQTDLKRIATTLNVRTVLEGSVRRAPGRVRVTAQLVDADTGFHVWSQRYDRDVADIFAVQDDIAASIAAALHLELSPPAAAQRHEIPGLRAYELYLQGLHQLRQHTEPSLMQATELLGRAIELAPEYAAAHAALAMCNVILATESMRPAHEVMPIARANARRALELDPSNVDALASVGQVAISYDYDRREADRVWKALGNRVDSFNAVYFQIGYHGGPSTLPGVVDLLERALRVDPLNLLFRAILANAWMWMRQHDRAFAEARKLLELEVPFYGAYGVIAQSYICLGRIRDAVDAAEKSYRAAPWHARAIGTLAAALKLDGQSARAEELLRELRRAENPLGVPMGMIAYHLLAGEPDDVLDWYERAVEEREPLAGAYVQDPNTAPLHSNPRWIALLRTMGIPES